MGLVGRKIMEPVEGQPALEISVAAARRVRILPAERPAPRRSSSESAQEGLRAYAGSKSGLRPAPDRRGARGGDLLADHDPGQALRSPGGRLRSCGDDALGRQAAP